MIFNLLSSLWIIFIVLYLQKGLEAKHPQLVYLARRFTAGMMIGLYIFNLVTNGNLANTAATILAFVSMFLAFVTLPKLSASDNKHGQRVATVAMWFLIGFSLVLQVVHLVIFNILPYINN